MILVTTSGSYDRTESWLKRMASSDKYRSLSRLAEQGKAALAGATPVDSGETANSWTYDVVISGSGASITWRNTNVVNGFQVAIGLQYGHGTGTGGYVQGRDYINPAIQPVMDRIAEEVWREVTRG